jgi:ATP-dependent DNA helicase RecQ
LRQRPGENHGVTAALQEPALRDALKSTFGYDSFRPLQQEIIAATLEGADVLALLPTGGGKSLCFQLPALMQQTGLTLVVSPLIALMKDQVDALTLAGIPATFLNSTLLEGEARARLRDLYDGRLRLLYVAPERLMLPSFLEKLSHWNVVRVAIDEAHCISEWGHDFRPEYRRLAELRERLPGVPFLALTATATERVRQDIEKQLGLRDARRFTGSFNRRNLSYRVTAKDKPYKQLVRFLAERKGDSGIVYAQSRKSVESLAERLRADGFAARPYHAGLSDTDRSLNQERFLRDDVRVICATIAFGMGINKPNVRFVVHYDLPKNVEGYYQETGRAGRDGLPSDCLLLFSAADVVKQTSFIEQAQSAGERRILRTQLQQMVSYAESRGCRRRELLAYFGERFEEPSCGGCDNCLEPPETFDGTLEAQKFLSSVYRAQQASYSGEASFGINHHADLLTGVANERALKWGHERLSTFGIGKERSRAEWQLIGRELVRLGLLRLAGGEYPTLALSEEGALALRSRRSIELTRLPDTSGKAARPEKRRRDGAIDCDEALFEMLRALRREIADARGVPAYLVFGDVTLRAMAREYPASDAELLSLPGVGAKKLADFGARFKDAIAEFLKTSPRQSFG